MKSKIFEEIRKTNLCWVNGNLYIPVPFNSTHTEILFKKYKLFGFSDEDGETMQHLNPNSVNDNLVDDIFNETLKMGWIRVGKILSSNQTISFMIDNYDKRKNNIKNIIVDFIYYNIHISKIMIVSFKNGILKTLYEGSYKQFLHENIKIKPIKNLLKEYYKIKTLY